MAVDVGFPFYGPSRPRIAPPLVHQEWNTLFHSGSGHGWSPKMVTVRARHGKEQEATVERKTRDRLGPAVSQRGLL